MNILFLVNISLFISLFSDKVNDGGEGGFNGGVGLRAAQLAHPFPHSKQSWAQCDPEHPHQLCH